jgi:Domain of Unknown Function (DUF1259)
VVTDATGSPGKAAITGDFVLLGSEVNPVLRAVRQHGIEVTALHSHMIDDSPHLFFMHFWANDDAQKLAQGLRAALVALFRWKVSDPLLMGVTAVAGLIAYPLLQPAWVMVK